MSGCLKTAERELVKSKEYTKSLSAYGLTLSLSVHSFWNHPGNKGSHGEDLRDAPALLCCLVCVCLALMSLVHYLNSFAPSILTRPTSSPLQAVLLSRQHFNKQSPRNKMLLNRCILLAGSEQAVYRGACQLLPLGCCSMWKQWRESAFDASPTWFSHSVLLFSL